ncbi:CbiX/SirB N-terminal domain-containing protein [endosymbiont 'TC1' of Trimyema compressum]|uniref:sirohydrochlorin chelatase n=1 Tax=endosymbiont 'TC1' of Trimyema compressum TaxID=243899 RepID=UPI00316AD9D6
MPEAMIETAFMEFSDSNLEAGLDALVTKGATEIAVVPYFLFKGIHIREDIPQAIGEYLKNHEGVQVFMSNTLGEDSRLADILTDRVKEVM